MRHEEFKIILKDIGQGLGASEITPNTLDRNESH